MIEPVPLETPLGVLVGRTIELVEITVTAAPRELLIRGVIWLEGGDRSFTLRLRGVVSHRVDEYDFSDLPGRANLVELPGSAWLAACRVRDHSAKLGPHHRHLALRTYDDVIEALCTDHELELGPPRPRDLDPDPTLLADEV